MSEKSIGALWEKGTGDKKYFSGEIENEKGEKSQIVVFRNSYKEQEKHPDWKIFKSVPKEERASSPISKQPEEPAQSEEDSSGLPF